MVPLGDLGSSPVVEQGLCQWVCAVLLDNVGGLLYMFVSFLTKHLVMSLYMFECFEI